ncbi:MAG: uracil-DNA glycosylase [Candidatus Marinimicrobia bacterium]|nr:uracil-DNA glycosylase [Candidatus Neomarinimicrobiota bacterium]MCF7921893.1 uracil-DNA glycosylase [Candidatus Neomarinimicrobiota bacterium]
MNKHDQIKAFVKEELEIFGGPLYMPESQQETDTERSPVSTDIQTLSEFNTAIEGCMNCPLGATRTKFVFGVGNPNADLMFVGEAPGEKEDLEGVPFVGRAGKLLTDILKAIDLQREDVYIANVLKCRPPNNRDPNKEEIETCEPYLLKQIELIKPKLLVALGRISASTLLRTKDSLTSMRGKVFDYHGTDMVVTYHPAALLRNPNWKRPAWEDFKKIREMYLEKRGEQA